MIPYARQWRGRQLVRLISVLAVACFIRVPHSRAATPGSLQLGVSYLSYADQKLSGSATGQANALGPAFYTLDAQVHIGLGKSAMISPALGYMPPSLMAQQAPDKGSKTSLMTVAVPLVFNLGSSWDLGVGPALLRYTTTGKGGTIDLDNGNGKTTFYLPKHEVTATTVALQTGAALNLGAFRAGLDLLTSGLLSTDRRTFSLVLTLGGKIYAVK